MVKNDKSGRSPQKSGFLEPKLSKVYDPKPTKEDGPDSGGTIGIYNISSIIYNLFGLLQ